MTEYKKITSFGTIYLRLGNISSREQPSTLKHTLGKMLVEKSIPLRDTKDTVLSVPGIITGLSRTPGESVSTALERDRLALIDLDDGNYHAWIDGRHNGNFVIIPGSLIWDDSADRVTGNPYKFTMEVKSW